MLCGLPGHAHTGPSSPSASTDLFPTLARVPTGHSEVAPAK